MAANTFPARPAPPNPSKYASYQTKGTPKHVEALLSALGLGVVHLADKVFDIDNKTQWMAPSLFGSANDDVPIITGVLSLMNEDLIKVVIANKIHTCFDSAVNKSLELPVHNRVKGAQDNVEEPVIYAMALCGPNGETLSKTQLEEVLETMSNYCKTNWRNAAEWQDADDDAKTIDFISPSVPGNRRD